MEFDDSSVSLRLQTSENFRACHLLRLCMFINSQTGVLEPSNVIKVFLNMRFSHDQLSQRETVTGSYTRSCWSSPLAADSTKCISIIRLIAFMGRLT